MENEKKEIEKKSYYAYLQQLKENIDENELDEYNDYIIDLFEKTKNWGKPSRDEISVSQRFRGPCGDSMKFFLNIKNGIIKKARFITDGCGASVATASQTTLLIEGKSLNKAKKLTAEDIDSSLGGLPIDHKHCAELAIKTLNRALKQYENQYD